MADEITLSNLNHRSWSQNASNDRNFNLSMEGYGGRTSLTMFDRSSNGGKPPFRLQLPPDFANATEWYFKDLAAKGGSNVKETVNITDRIDGKQVNVGSVTFGYNEKGTPYIGITSPAGQHMFPLYMSLKLNWNESSMTPKARAEIAIKTFLDTLRGRAMVSEVLTNVKRPPGSFNKGGNRGGGGGYGGGNRPSYGNNSGGGDRISDSDVAF